jgi:hypothetical protein
LLRKWSSNNQLAAELAVIAKIFLCSNHRTSEVINPKSAAIFLIIAATFCSIIIEIFTEQATMDILLEYSINRLQNHHFINNNLHICKIFCTFAAVCYDLTSKKHGYQQPYPSTRVAQR